MFAQGLSVRGTTRLVARSGDGPTIRALASVAILKGLVDGTRDFRGADHAGHYIETSEIMALVPDLAIALEQTVEAGLLALFHNVPGDTGFAIMPQVTKALHRGAPAVISAAFVDIEPADNFLGGRVSALFRFPQPWQNVPVRL